jgi:recombination protein RecT
VTNTETGIVKAVEASLWQREEAIRSILPNGMDMKRFVRVTMIALSKNPYLQKCTQESLVRSIIEAASVGLEPTGMLNRAWLVPYNNKKKGADGKDYWEDEAQLAIGWEGLIDLARNSGQVRKVTARVVYEGDDFTITQGTEERLDHAPAFLTEDPLKITHVYCVVTYRDGTTQHEVMTRTQVDGVRAKAKAKNAMAWTDSYPEMARKTVVRRAMKYLPLTPEVIEAVARDDEREYGTPTVAQATGTRTSSLREAIKAQAEEIEGEAIEVPVESADQPTEHTSDTSTSEAVKSMSAEQAGKAAQAKFEADFNAKQKAAQASTGCVSADPDGGAICDRDQGHPGSHMAGSGKGREAW